MSKMKIEGVIPPMMTPFTEDQSVDYDKHVRNMEKWNQDKLAGYLVLGSNSEASYLSEEEKIKLKVLSDGRLNLTVKPKLIALDEVIINSEKEHIVRSTQMGYQKLETKKINEIPLVLGEQRVGGTLIYAFTSQYGYV